VKPHPINNSIVPFTVTGFWISDPAVSGLGHDVWQTPAALQADYLPLNGQYRAVYEPPLNLDRVAFYEKLQKTKISLAEVQPNENLRKEIVSVNEKNGGALSIPQPLASAASFEQISSPVPPEVFSKDYLRQALPKALRQDGAFMLLFEKSESIRQFNVYDKDRNKNYILLALDSTDSVKSGVVQLYASHLKNRNMIASSGVAKTKIVLEVDPATGAILEATWDEQGEIYPKVSQSQAVQNAQNSLPAKQEKAGYSKNTKAQVKSTRLVWARDLGTSRFHPKWEVLFVNNQESVVGQNIAEARLSQNISLPNSQAENNSSAERNQEGQRR
jgi:hypothetical protein